MGSVQVGRPRITVHREGSSLLAARSRIRTSVVNPGGTVRRGSRDRTFQIFLLHHDSVNDDRAWRSTRRNASEKLSRIRGQVSACQVLVGCLNWPGTLVGWLNSTSTMRIVTRTSAWGRILASESVRDVHRDKKADRGSLRNRFQVQVVSHQLEQPKMTALIFQAITHFNNHFIHIEMRHP